MRVAFGTKAHSGWAALVVLDDDGSLLVVDRRRMELALDARDKQPYHAAERLKPEAARALVERGIRAARGAAVQGLKAAMARAEEEQHEVLGCAVLVGEPMPDWTTDEILSVHVRMHKAEGVSFRIALVEAARACGLALVAIPEKRLMDHAEKALRTPAAALSVSMAALGRSVGAPWGKDQKDAALAALVALRGRPPAA